MPIRRVHRDEATGRPVLKLWVQPSEVRLKAMKRAGSAVAPRAVVAMIDTGCSQTLIRTSVLDAMGLGRAKGMTVLSTVHGGDEARECETYDLSIRVEGENKPLAVEVAGAKLSLPALDALLGRDVLDRCLLVYDGPSRSLTLAW